MANERHNSESPRRRRSSTLRTCILLSILLHLLLIVQFNWMPLSMAVMRFVREELGMEIPLNLAASRVAEVQLQVRNQLTDIAPPPSPVELPRTPTMQVAVESPNPLTIDLPTSQARPGEMSIFVPPPSMDLPQPTEQPATPLPPLQIESPRLDARLPEPVTQAEENPQVDPPQPSVSHAEPRVSAQAEQIVLGAVPLNPDTAAVGPPLVAISPNPPDPVAVEAGPNLDAAVALDLQPAVITHKPISEQIQTPQLNAPDVSPQRQPPATRPSNTGTPDLPVPAVAHIEPTSIELATQNITPPVLAAIDLSPSIEPPPVDAPAIELPTAAAPPPPSSDPQPTLTDTPLATTSTHRPEPFKPRETLLPIDPLASLTTAPLPDVLPNPHEAALAPQSIEAHAAIASLPGTLGPRNVDVAGPAPLIQRSPEVRQPLIEERGGTKESEDAVSLSLAWLARNQAADGRWTYFTSPSFTGKGRSEHDIALTGLAALCFLAADHTPAKDGPYHQTTSRAIDWLAAQQKSTGDLRGRGNMYDHAIATIALAESAVMTRDLRHRGVVFKAAQYIVAAQNADTGGWQYAPGDLGDTSVLGWQIMALFSSQQLGFPIPKRTRDGALRWLDHVTERGSLRAGYQSRSAITPSMTAQAVFSRILLGQDLSPDSLREASVYIGSQPPGKGEKDSYYWYYASLMLAQLQNDAWMRWNLRTRDYLVRMQRRDGPAAGATGATGSFDPDGKWADSGGRVYSTAMATLTLEVYYRYLPLYTVGPSRAAP